MDKVKFQEQRYSARVNMSGSKKGILNWVIKTGIAKDKKSAEIVLLVSAVVVFVLAMSVLAFGSSGTSTQTVDHSDDYFYDGPGS